MSDFLNESYSNLQQPIMSQSSKSLRKVIIQVVRGYYYAAPNIVSIWELSISQDCFRLLYKEEQNLLRNSYLLAFSREIYSHL